MYLLVFVTLIVALIGIYTQVLSVQTAKLFSNQTTLAKNMLAWHSTAIAHARYAMQSTYAATPVGCSLTTSLTVPAICLNGSSMAVDGAQGGMQTCPAATAGQSCWTNLPTGYLKTPYTFYSIFYAPASGGRYVITYVPAPTATNPAPGFLTLPGPGAPGAVQIGFTESDLYEQINNIGLSVLSYGTVKNQQITTHSISNGTTSAPLVYTLPSGATVPDGSIAIISSP